MPRTRDLKECRVIVGTCKDCDLKPQSSVGAFCELLLCLHGIIQTRFKSAAELRVSFHLDSVAYCTLLLPRAYVVN